MNYILQFIIISSFASVNEKKKKNSNETTHTKSMKLDNQIYTDKEPQTSSSAF